MLNPRRMYHQLNVSDSSRNLPGYYESPAGAEVSAIPGETIGAERQVDYRAVLRRNRWVLLALPLLGLAAGYMFSRLQAPVYEARTTIEVRPLNENFLNTRELNRSGALTDSGIEPYIEAQVELLHDPELVGRVMDQLRGEHGSATGVPRDAAIRQTLHNVTVTPIIPARLLRISYDSTDPVFAAHFANALAEQFLQEKLNASREAARKTTEWLAGQSEELKRKLERSEGELQDYARNNNLIYTNDNDSGPEGRLRSLDRDLAAAQTDRITKQSQLAMAAATNPAVLPQVMASGRVQEYQGKLTELRRQKAEFLALLTPENYKVQRLDAQIAELESALKDEMTRIPEALRNEFSAAQQREKLLAEAYADQAKQVSLEAVKAIHYLTLKQQVETTRALRAAFVQRTEEAAMIAALPESDIHVLSAAIPPIAPVRPNRFLLVSLGLFAGFFGGLVLTGLRELKDSTIKVPRECSAMLNLPMLGVIPSAKVDWKAIAPGRWIENRELQQRKLDRISLDVRNSILAESFRSTLASICFSGAEESVGRVLVFTSPGPHEGKTTVICNIGFALAGIDRKVLLINADSRHPRLQISFDLSEKPGLADLLKGDAEITDCDLEEYISRSTSADLAVMGCGRARNISRLLYSDRLPLLMARLRQMFDMILIDSPPAMQIADARVLARSADGVVLVVRAGTTTLSAAGEAASRFAADNTRILGTILNDWDPNAGDSESLREFSKMYRHYYSHSNS